MMRFASIIPLVLLHSACSAHQDEHARIASAIDAALTLPKGALSADSYARYYTVRPDGKIHVIYTASVRDDAPKPADYGCSEVTADFTLVDVPCPPDDRPKAKQQLWVSNSEMPAYDDGGCSIINVIYNPESQQVEKAACNGS